jgi:hypothetical protein
VAFPGLKERPIWVGLAVDDRLAVVLNDGTLMVCSFDEQ